MNACRSFRALMLAALLAAGLAASSCADRPARVLFVGNSLTYVGNLPAVLEALCRNSTRKCTAEMIVEGGATLSQRVADQTLERITATAGGFDFVVLQERGGDYLFLRSRPEITVQAEQAAEVLVRDAAGRGMRPVLLGTYQGDPRASVDLVAAESALAAKLGFAHVPVSGHLMCGRQRHPSLRWMDADGLHPGPELTLLMAALVYRELFGMLPEYGAFSMRAPIYGPMNSPRASDLASAQPAPARIVRTVDYDAATMRAVLDLIQEPCP